MKKIGITGGIGSGKSTVARIFESMGYHIYYADARAKALMVEDSEIIKGLQTLFGKKAYLPDGQLNRKHIGAIAFENPEKLQQLNALVHPRTGRDFLNWAQAIPEDYPHAFILKEAAILFESGAYLATDAVISVYAPKDLRIKRVMARDKVSREEVAARMQRQWPEQEKLGRADVNIFNDGHHVLIPQVLAAIRFFQAKFKGNNP